MAGNEASAKIGRNPRNVEAQFIVRVQTTGADAHNELCLYRNMQRTTRIAYKYNIRVCSTSPSYDTVQYGTIRFLRGFFHPLIVIERTKKGICNMCYSSRTRWT